MSKPRIAIVGAGVSGLSVGVCLMETLGRLVDVTILSEKFIPHIGSNTAVAFFMPGVPFTGDINQPSDKASELWCKDTLERLTRIHQSSDEGSGISQIDCYRCFRDAHGDPSYKHLLVNFRVVPPDEARALRFPPELKTVWSFKTFVINPMKYLSWLMKKFQDGGGHIVQCKVHSLQELRDYDVIINCSGLGARELAGDLSVYPVRGQLVAVKAPWIRHIRTHGEYDLSAIVHIVPCDGEVILGGVGEPNVWSADPNPTTTDAIYKKCLKLCPDLEGAEVLYSWTGFRPVRKTVRVEVEDSDASPVIVHNYGHGGEGYSLSWGCAKEVVMLVHDFLQKRIRLSPISKL